MKDQQELLIRIMETVNILNINLRLENYFFFQNKLKDNLVAKQTLTNEVVILVFKILDNRLKEYEIINQQLFQTMKSGQVRDKIRVIEEIASNKINDNENFGILQEILSFVD